MNLIQKQTEGKKEVEVVIDVPKLIKELGTKSAVIRKLTADGLSRSEVSKVMKIRYQHVRNVLITPIKKAK